MKAERDTDDGDKVGVEGTPSVFINGRKYNGDLDLPVILITGNPSIGLLCGMLGVIPLALLQAFLSVTLRANQIVTGIGINILALGGTTLAYREIFGERSTHERLKEIEATAGDSPIRLRSL